MANDLVASVPGSCTVTFPRLVGGAPDGTSVSYPVTLASLNLPEFQGVTGFPGSALLHSTATAAAPAGGGVPTNDGELLALARQLAQDWYRHRLASHDVLYAGVAPWVPSGVTDVAEWSQTPTQVVTRARRGPWLDHREEVFHFSPGAASQPGAGGAPTPGSVTPVTPGNPGGPVSGGGEFLFPGGGTVVYPTGSVTIQGGTPVTPTPAPLTISTTPQNNYPLPAGGVVVLNPTTPATITGFVPAVPNQTITLVNTGTVPITIPNADPGSSTPNQVKPPWGGPIIIPPNGGMVQLQAGGGAGGGWGVLNPGPMPVLWTAPSPVIPVGGNLNDFNPGGFGIIPLDPQGGNWNLTGLQAQFPGAHLTITVPATATGTVTLTNQDPASSLGDQLSLAAGNVTLHPGESLDLTAGAGGDFGTTTNLNGPAATATGTNYPGWVKVTKTFTDFAAASTTNTVTVYTLPAKSVIHACLIKHTAAFTGGALTAYNLTTVQGGSTYFGGSGAYALFQAPANVGQGKMQPFAQTGYGSLEDFGAAKAVTASLQSIGANLNAATAGSVNIYFLVSTLP